jgi:probable O-glycosylation ligase (exosortase A-associated)
VSYRDVIVFVTILALLPRAFTKPFFGLLLFSWLAYMRPQDLCWGFARNPTWRYSLFCALLMYSGWFLFERRKFTKFAAPMGWLTAFILFLSVSLIINGPSEHQLDKYFDLLKVFLVAYFTVGMVDDKQRFDKLLWVIALSLGFFGVKCGLHCVLTGGRILQGPGGMLMDNNDLCLAMAMNIPLLFFMGRHAERRWVRRLCKVAVALTCVTIVFTMSRGGFLTACVVGFLIFNKLKRSLLPWIVVGAVVCVTPFLLPTAMKERLATLENPEEESSAAGRLHAWGVGLKMVQANPFFGVGFEAFLFNFRRFDPLERRGGSIKSVRVAHNTYVQVWAELGTFALISFLGMLFASLTSLRRTRRQALQRDGPRWIVDYADMIQVSILAFMFGANFLNRAHFDLLYHLVALTVALHFIARAELRGATAPAPARTPFAASPALAAAR